VVRTGEGYGSATNIAPPAAADDPIVRERATTAREFDPAEKSHGHHADAVPIDVARLPLTVVVSVSIS